VPPYENHQIKEAFHIHILLLFEQNHLLKEAPRNHNHLLFVIFYRKKNILKNEHNPSFSTASVS
jgi:hypothetical protein